MFIKRFQQRLTAFFSSPVSGFVVVVDAPDPDFEFVFLARTTVLFGLTGSDLDDERGSATSLGALPSAFCSGCTAFADPHHTTHAPVSNQTGTLLFIWVLIE